MEICNNTCNLDGADPMCIKRDRHIGRFVWYTIAFPCNALAPMCSQIERHTFAFGETETKITVLWHNIP